MNKKYILSICYSIFLTFGLPVLTNATPPTIGPKPIQERNKIEQLRYDTQDTFQDAETKFIANAKRECSGYGYSSEDGDLTVELVQKTFPESLNKRIIDNNLSVFCPRFVLDQTKRLSLNDGKKLLWRYFSAIPTSFMPNIDDQYWSSTKPIADLLAKECSIEDVQVFQRLYCSSIQEAHLKGGYFSPFIKMLKEDFIKECPLAHKNFLSDEMCVVNKGSFLGLFNAVSETQKDGAKNEKLMSIFSSDMKFSNDFSCSTDADCYVTKSGACLTGKVMAESFGKELLDNSTGRCRCLKGPTVFGCESVSK